MDPDKTKTDPQTGGQPDPAGSPQATPPPAGDAGQTSSVGQTPPSGGSDDQPAPKQDVPEVVVPETPAETPSGAKIETGDEGSTGDAEKPPATTQ